MVQAIIIYLDFVGQKNGNRAIWSLTGLLIRTAVSMGLHRDGSHFPNISPFEAEMRRRLWWNICFIDSRVGDGQVSEVSISESIFDTREPTNLDDADINPDMTELPSAREGVTDTTLCLLRCELWRLVRRIQCSLSVSRPHKVTPGLDAEQEELDMRLKSQQRIESDFLRHLDPDKPMHSFIAALARMSLARAELVTSRGNLSSGATSSPTNNHKRNRAFLTSLASLETAHALEASPQTRKWGWVFRGCIPWHAISILLAQLRTRPWGPTCERAWAAVERVVDGIPEAARREALRRPVWGLMADARRHRGREIRRVRADPGVARQLGLLAGMGVESCMATSVEQAVFDTAAAEERLELETAVSRGARILEPADIMGSTFESCPLVTSAWQAMCSTDVGTAPFGVDGFASNPAADGPRDDPMDLPSAETRGVGVHGFYPTLRDAGCFDSGILPAEGGMPFFNETNPVSGAEGTETSWLGCNRMLGSDEVPW